MSKEGGLKVLPESEVIRLFGDFHWRKNGNSAIEITDDWVERNIVTVYIPALDGVPTDGGRFNGRVRFHKKGAEQLQRAFAEIAAKGLADRVIDWGGSFVPRLIRGSSSKRSRHSWGAAFDINVPDNFLGDPPAKLGQRGYLGELVPIFERHGFCWGGTWSRPDGMHFEIAKLIDYAPLPAEKPARPPLLIVNNRVKEALPMELRDGVNYAPLAALGKLVGDTEATGDRVVAVASYLRSHGYEPVWNGDQKKLYAYGPKKIAAPGPDADPADPPAPEKAKDKLEAV